MEEKIFIKNNKKLKLSAIINKPERVGHFPMVILLVGFGGYKEWLPFEMLSKELKRNKIGSIRFDPSGFGESEGIIEKDYKISNYVEDAQIVLNYARNLDWVDNEAIGVFGHSMGGILASVITNKNNALIKALSLVSSPVMLGNDDDLEGKYKKWKETGQTERSNSKYGKFYVPFSFLEDARKWNALDYLKGLDIPTQVICSENDINVPNKITKQLYDSVAGLKQFETIEGADHFLNRDPKIIQVMVNKVTEFMLKKLK